MPARAALPLPMQPQAGAPPSSLPLPTSPSPADPPLGTAQDGGLHVSIAHPGLAAGLDLSSYSSEVHGRVSIQSCRPRAGEARLAGRHAMGRTIAEGDGVSVGLRARSWRRHPSPASMHTPDACQAPGCVRMHMSTVMHVYSSYLQAAGMRPIPSFTRTWRSTFMVTGWIRTSSSPRLPPPAASFSITI